MVCPARVPDRRDLRLLLSKEDQKLCLRQQNIVEVVNADSCKNLRRNYRHIKILFVTTKLGVMFGGNFGLGVMDNGCLSVLVRGSPKLSGDTLS